MQNTAILWMYNHPHSHKKCFNIFLSSVRMICAVSSLGADKCSSYIDVKKFEDALRKAVATIGHISSGTDASQTHFQLDKSIRAFLKPCFLCQKMFVSNLGKNGIHPSYFMPAHMSACVLCISRRVWWARLQQHRLGPCCDGCGLQHDQWKGLLAGQKTG